jgi:hypothetical protein
MLYVIQKMFMLMILSHDRTIQVSLYLTKELRHLRCDDKLHPLHVFVELRTYVAQI